MKLSIIIPTLNEAAIIGSSLAALKALRQAGHEIIVVDGGSQDETVQLAKSIAGQICIANKGRASQMNKGAEIANGDVLVFLHADSSLPPNADSLIIEGLIHSNKSWGRFDVQLTGSQPFLRIVETLMNWRSRISGIATGDQCLFVSRELFDHIGGFPEIALMEDIAISKRLKRSGQPLCIKRRVITSSRRWERQGTLRTVLLMWRLRAGYFLGESPEHLARRYY
jgi:rSAM/selenodomain-associated transferase 2